MVMKMFGEKLRRGEFFAADVQDSEKINLFIDTVGFENAKSVFESEGAKEILQGIDFPDDKGDMAVFYESVTPEQGKQLSDMLDSQLDVLEVPK